MKTYTVSHTTDVDCDSPQEAAEIFLDFLRDTRTDEDGNAFTVRCGKRRWTVVLYEDGSVEVKTHKQRSSRERH